MSVTASAVIASTLMVSDGADETVKSEKNVEAPWTVSLKHTPKVKHINASEVLQNRLVKKDSEEEDDSSARASRKASASGTYTVESGDTISEIAYSFGISTEQLMAWNNLDSTIIMPGQEVTLEEAASDTLYADNSNEVEEEVVEEVVEVTEPEESLEIVEVEEPQVETSTPDNEVAVASAEPVEEEPQAEEPVVEEPVVEEEVVEEPAVEEPAVEEEDQADEGIAVAATMAVAEDEPEEEVDDEGVEEEEVVEEAVEEEETSSTPQVATMSVSTTNNQVEEDQAEVERQEQAEAEKQAQAEKDKQAEAERQAQAEKEKQAEAERQAQAEKDKQAEAERQAQAEKDKQAEAEKQKEQEPAPQPSGDLISNAKSVMGTPYVWGGTSTSGFDCSGFIYWAHKQSGNDIGRTSTDGYYKTSYIVNNPQPGDLVFFEGTYRSGISHMGNYLGGGQFIHAGSSTGVAIASVHSGYWGDHFHSYKRIY